MAIGTFRWGNTRYDTLIDNGPSENRLDVAILGDGYSADEMEMFNADVDSIIQAFHKIEPTKTYIEHFNFHRVNVVSPKSGIYDRWVEINKVPRKRDKFFRELKRLTRLGDLRQRSPLGSHFSFLSSRRLVGWDWRVRQVANRSGVPWDSLLVVVNTPRRGGATAFWMTVGYASRNSSDFPHIMIHEAGHSIAKLMDEYVDPLFPDFPSRAGRSLPGLLPFANIDTNGRRPKWHLWVDKSCACPTPLKEETPHGIVGAFEGAGYTEYGCYRPTRDCMMRHHNQPFCPVCREQWIKRIYRKTSIADARTPDQDLEAVVSEGVSFSADVIKPDHIHTVWRMRDQQGRWQVKQETDSFAPVSLKFPTPGRWTVECVLEDRNPMVRQPAVIKKTHQKLRWVVKVK